MQTSSQSQPQHAAHDLCILFLLMFLVMGVLLAVQSDEAFAAVREALVNRLVDLGLASTHNKVTILVYGTVRFSFDAVVQRSRHNAQHCSLSAVQLARCLAMLRTRACCATFQHPVLHMIMSCCIDIHKLADSQTAHVCRGRAEAFQTAVTCKRTWTTCTPSATSRRRRSRSCRTSPPGSWVRSKLACLLSVCSRLLGQNVDVICWLVLPHDIA